MPKNKNKDKRYIAAVRFLWNTIKPHKILYFAASLISLVSIAICIFQARVTRRLIDSAAGSELSEILFCLLLFIALAAAGLLLSYVSGICVSRLAARSGRDLKRRIAEALIYAKYGEMASMEAGNTLQTVGADTDTVCGFLAGDLIGLFSQFTLALGVLIYILCLNPVLALVTFTYTPLGMFFTMTLNKKMNELYPIKAECEGRALSAVEQALSCIPVIKSFMAERYIRERVEREYESVRATTVKIQRYNALMQPACSSTSMVPRIVYLIFAGFMAAGGFISAGTLVSVFDLLTYIIGPTVYMPFLLNGLNRSIASMNRIDRLLSIERADKREVVGGTPGVVLENVSFSYGGDKTKPVIKGLSFSHKGYGVIALCGSSGSGKTTLLDLISGLYQPDGGSVSVTGVLSYMPQEAYMFDMSIAENVRVARPNASDSEVSEALRAAGADGIIDAAGLSGGQKQRVSMARTILSDSSVWLLDEPTSALDGETEAIITDTIRRYADRRLIIIAAHGEALKAVAQRRLEL